MEVKIFAKTNNSLQGLINHFKDSKKLKNRLTLKMFGISQEMDADKKVLKVNFKGLIKKITNKGGSFQGYKDKVKQDFLKELSSSMHKAGASKEDYEVIFND